MVKYEPIDFDLILHAISDSTRRRILDELYRGEKTVGELAEPFKISLPAISKHIKILKKVGLLSTRKEGRRVICTLMPVTLMRVATWLARYERFWKGRLKKLEEDIKAQRFDR
jgi:DNA-binding transcriptional ArsR family regulator